jgi:TolB-like protein
MCPCPNLRQLATACVAAGLWLTAAPLGAQAVADSTRRPTLGVVAFTNAAMRDRADWESQRQGIAELVTTMLRYHPGVVVLEREQLQPLLKEQDLGASGRVEPETAARIGQLLGAKYMLLGTISVDPRNRLRLAARAVDVETSRVLQGEMVDGDADDVMVLVDRLTERLPRSLSLPPLPPRGDPDAGAGPDAATSVRVTRTAKAINPPRAGADGYRALRLMSLAMAAAGEGRTADARSLYRQALQAQPDLVAVRDRLAMLERQ